jgi:hypothetical protein
VCRRQRFPCAWGRAAAAEEEEAGSSGIDSGGGDRRSRERWSREREQRGLREFWDEKRNDMGQTDIYRFKNIMSGFKSEPLLIVLESGLKQFWFKTTVDEGTISSSLQLESLLIN